MEHTNNVDRLLRREDVADRLGISPKTLEKWAANGRGPDYVRVGRLVRYPQSGVNRWIASQTVTGNAA